MKEKEIIDNYRDLPFGKYEEIVRLCETEMTDLDRKVAVISVLTGKTEDEVLKLPLDTFTRYSAATKFLEAECPENLIPAVAKSYPVGGFVLVPVTDMREVTAAQYIDFQTFAPQGDAALVELLSVVLIPDDAPGYNDGYDIAAVQTAIRADLSVNDALALAAFFLSKYAALIRSTATSLKRLARRERNPQRREAMESRLEILTEAREKLTAGLTASLVAGDGLPRWTE